MTSIADIIKNKFLEEFTAITVGSLLSTLLLSFLLGLFVAVVYRLTYSGVAFSRTFALSLVMLSMVTALAILTVRSNVVLSLGMVGALSIVRFRTAIKDPMDTVFMFWSIVSGIITGAGYITVAVLATLVLGLLFVAVNVFSGRLNSNAYLVVVRCAPGADAAADTVVSKLSKYKLKSRNMSDKGLELVLEAKLSEKQIAGLQALAGTDGIVALNVVSYNGSTML